jgi:hypothetical protein
VKKVLVWDPDWTVVFITELSGVQTGFRENRSSVWTSCSDMLGGHPGQPGGILLLSLDLEILELSVYL